MALHLMKSSIRALLLNTSCCSYNGARMINIIKQDILTQNEKSWIEEQSKKLLENAKSEKGIDLKIDPKRPQLYFDRSDELQTANDTVKKILSLEFATRADYIRYEEELIRKEFQRNPLDSDSLEIQIALHTMRIRRMCNNMEEFKNKNNLVKLYLFRQLHRRDRLMAQLYYKDNKRYEWLKEKLNLSGYELKEAYAYRRVTRYEKFIREVEARAEQQRQAKLNQVREEFNAEKQEFLKQRNTELNNIEHELRQLGVKDVKFPEFNKNSL